MTRASCYGLCPEGHWTYVVPTPAGQAIAFHYEATTTTPRKPCRGYGKAPLEVKPFAD